MSFRSLTAGDERLFPESRGCTPPLLGNPENISAESFSLRMEESFETKRLQQGCFSPCFVIMEEARL